MPQAILVTRLVFDNHLFAQYPLTIYPRIIGTLSWLGLFVAAILLFIGECI